MDSLNDIKCLTYDGADIQRLGR